MAMARVALPWLHICTNMRVSWAPYMSQIALVVSAGYVICQVEICLVCVA